MNRKECNDKVNNERLETTRKRVAHAIQILKPATWCTYESDEQKAKLKTDIAHAVNLLEAAAEAGLSMKTYKLCVLNYTTLLLKYA